MTLYYIMRAVRRAILIKLRYEHILEECILRIMMDYMWTVIYDVTLLSSSGMCRPLFVY